MKNNNLLFAMTKKILIISLLILYSSIVFAQDTLFQCDLSVNPIHFDKMYSGIGNETSMKTRRSIVPSLTFCFPVYNKWSFTVGLKLYQGSYEGFFNDSTWRIIDPVNPDLTGHYPYIYHQKVSGSELSVIIGANYNLFYKKHFSSNISLGVELDTWDKIFEYYEFYPISATNNSQVNNKHFNSPIDESTYSPYFNVTLKYFPLKHFGLLLRPFISYSFFDDAVVSYLGVGICYK
jgi:hypothetical protein